MMMRCGAASVGGALRLLVALCAMVVMAPLAAARQGLTFRFDGGPVLDAPLEFVFERGASAIAPDGSTVGPGVPRYRRPTLLCPLPEVMTIPGTENLQSMNMIGAGVAADGVTPVWVVSANSKIKLQVFVGSMLSPPFEYSMGYNGFKGLQMDVLVDSVDNVPGEAWRPVSGTVCHGFIVLQCNVAVPGTSGWVSSRVGFLTCRVSDLSGPSNLWWRRHSVSDAMSPLEQGVGLGASWSLSTWWSTRRDGSAPTKAWIAATDYHSAPGKDGGAYFVFPIQRPTAASADWTASPVVELPGRWTDPTNRSHAHTLGVAKLGEQGLVALGSRGDSIGNAVDYAWSLVDESQYAAGATPNAGAVNWLTAGPVWTGPVVVHGHLDPSLADLRVRQKGNQFVGIAPGPTDGSFLTGGDEVTDAFALTTSLSGGIAPLRFTAPYAITHVAPLLGEGTNGPWRHYLSFHVHAQDPNVAGGAYVAQLGPSQSDADGWNNQRVAFSPDGLRWAQAWTHFEGAQAPVWLVDGRIWTGSYGKNSGLGVRSIAAPDPVDASPLTVAPGGRNAASAAPTVTDMGVGVSVQLNPSLPPGVSQPPSAGPWYRVENQPPTAVTGSSQLGRFRLGGGVPSGTREVTVKLWVRHDTPAESGRADSLEIMAGLRASDAADSPGSVRSSALSTAIDLSTSGQWMPLILTTDLGMWADTAGWEAEGGVLDLVLTSAWGVAGPASFYIAVESVSWTPSPPYPSAVESTLPDERAEISGFSIPGNWTVFLAGMVPESSWDSSWAGMDPPMRPLFSIVSETGLSWVDVLAERGQSSVVLRGGGLAAGAEPVTIRSYHWWAGSPVLLAVAHCAEWDAFILYGSVGNSVLRGSYPMIGVLDSPAAKIRMGSGDGMAMTEFDVFGGAIVEGEATLADAAAVFRTLPMLRGLPMPAMSGDCTDMQVGECTADFDGSGFTDLDDYDAFIHAFETGVDEADFDQSGFVDTDDFDAFVVAFITGC